MKLGQRGFKNLGNHIGPALYPLKELRDSRGERPLKTFMSNISNVSVGGGRSGVVLLTVYCIQYRIG